MTETGKIFDKYFSDDFFNMNMEPFGKIQEFHDTAMKKMGPEKQNLFGTSWDNWHKKRFDVSEITPSVTNTKEGVVMVFKIPNVDNKLIKVNLNDKRIDLEYDMKKTEESKVKNNQEYSSMQEHFSKILPVPANVTASKAKVDAKADGITILFPKKG
jgi:HSP20 family molecular chaperone IbpA